MGHHGSKAVHVVEVTGAFLGGIVALLSLFNLMDKRDEGAMFGVPVQFHFNSRLHESDTRWLKHHWKDMTMTKLGHGGHGHWKWAGVEVPGLQGMQDGEASTAATFLGGTIDGFHHFKYVGGKLSFDEHKHHWEPNGTFKGQFLSHRNRIKDFEGTWRHLNKQAVEKYKDHLDTYPGVE